MTINVKIKDENVQYDINTAAAKLSALSSGKIYLVSKYCHLIKIE